MTRDPEGQDFPDLNAARIDAVEGAREIAADRVKSGEPINLADSFEIADEAGQIQTTVQFGEAVDVIGNDIK